MFTVTTNKSNWVYYALIVLTAEKVVQHIFVTFAFYFNWGDIRSTVVAPPTILMILGVPLALSFGLSLWGMTRKQRWAVNLVIVLALCDIIGEFVAQGTIAILITVSFLVAVLLLILAVLYRRQRRKTRTQNTKTGDIKMTYL